MTQMSMSSVIQQQETNKECETFFIVKQKYKNGICIAKKNIPLPVKLMRKRTFDLGKLDGERNAITTGLCGYIKELKTFYYNNCDFPFSELIKFQIEEEKLKKKYNEVIEFCSKLSFLQEGQTYEMKNRDSLGIFWDNSKCLSFAMFGLLSKNKISFDKGVKKLINSSQELIEYFSDKCLDGDLYENNKTVNIALVGQKDDYCGEESKEETLRNIGISTKKQYERLMDLNSLANKIGWWD